MIHHVTTEIAVIGAGVVGLAVAEALVAQGHEVVLIDPEPPGSGASYGNAGTIADYAVLPVGTPDVLKNLPSLLFDRNSPLAIRPGAFMSLAPWLSRFMLQSRRKKAERNARAIATLLSGARELWQDLALRAKLGIPANLTALGVKAADLEMLTDMALEDPSCGGNPVVMTRENTRALFAACM
jgi:glycine/D-amino acid oxidase-like deaminating enzyme